MSKPASGKPNRLKNQKAAVLKVSRSVSRPLDSGDRNARILLSKNRWRSRTIRRWPRGSSFCQAMFGAAEFRYVR